MIVINRGVKRTTKNQGERRFSPNNPDIEDILDEHHWERVRVLRVSFDKGSRTYWHKHWGAQVLYVTEGKGFVQLEGEEARPIECGNTVYISPGEKHWHGAAPDHPLTHIAINIGGQTEWLEEVAEEEYTRIGSKRDT